MSLNVFIVFPYYPLNICRICSDVPFFIPDVGSLYLLFFFLVSVPRRLSMLLIFSKNHLLVSDFFGFLLFSCFQYYQYMLLSFVLALSLIYSSFFIFFKWKLRSLIINLSTLLIKHLML